MFSFWDDWLRQHEQRKGRSIIPYHPILTLCYVLTVVFRIFRSCIRPEISRTRTFGRKGVSHGQFYDKHLKYIVLNEIPYNFMAANLSYLLKVIILTCACIGLL